jgi:hypothetical protein
MFKSYRVKNPALNKELTNKFIVRLQATSAIAKNVLVERNSVSGAIATAGADSTRVIGVNPDRAVDAGAYFNCEIGIVYVVAGVDVVAGQRVKAGADGKLAVWDNAVDTADMIIGYVLVGASARSDAVVMLS